ncbi:hypothetical protein BDR06DRAFT_1081 [Suillus hirtellus]|nr:hypothetical protein BDR06DRAFT_1081 [Suillus hirtellus]
MTYFLAGLALGKQNGSFSLWEKLCAQTFYLCLICVILSKREGRLDCRTLKYQRKVDLGMSQSLESHFLLRLPRHITNVCPRCNAGKS